VTSGGDFGRLQSAMSHGSANSPIIGMPGVPVFLWVRQNIFTAKIQLSAREYHRTRTLCACFWVYGYGFWKGYSFLPF
jgi:hypothetical protein